MKRRQSLTLSDYFDVISIMPPTQGATLTLDTIDLVAPQHQRRAGSMSSDCGSGGRGKACAADRAWQSFKRKLSKLWAPVAGI